MNKIFSSRFQPFKVASLGQPQQLLYPFGIDLPTEALTKDIEDLLGQLPPELFGKYKPKYEACLSQLSSNPIEGALCLRDLYKEIKNSSDTGKNKTPPSVPAPQASTFPWVPVAIGGGALVLLVVVLAAAR